MCSLPFSLTLPPSFHYAVVVNKFQTSSIKKDLTAVTYHLKWLQTIKDVSTQLCVPFLLGDFIRITEKVIICFFFCCFCYCGFSFSFSFHSFLPLFFKCWKKVFSCWSMKLLSELHNLLFLPVDYYIFLGRHLCNNTKIYISSWYYLFFYTTFTSYL